MTDSRDERRPVRRRRFLERAGVVATGALAGFAGCGGDAPTRTTPPEENAVGMYTKGSTVYFDPIGLFVEPGETVTWVLRSGRHSATAYEAGTSIARVTRIPEGADGWNSGVVRTGGATYEHTVEVAGTYDYFCVPHRSFGMVGRIVVGEPGGPAEERPIPHGDVPASSTIVERGSVSFAAFRQ